MISRLKTRFHILIGLMDVSTGLGLFFLPVWTMNWIQIDLSEYSPQALALLRFIGAFVFAVGINYFLPFFKAFRYVKTPQVRDFISVWQFTSVVRLIVGVSVSSLVYKGSLNPAWAIIGITDLFVAALQYHWITEAKSENN